MKKTIIYFLALGVLINITSCNSQNCNDSPSKFNSYEQAISKIKSTKFTLSDNVNTSRSSVIENADYYSCDGKIGYLIIEIRNTEYIYQNVPISVWQEFKTADSFGSFYNRNIKNMYNLNI